MVRLLVLLTAFSLVASAQEPQAPAELEIRIVSPEPDFYVSGPTLLKAEVLPKMLATRVAQLLFFADGKQVCNVLDPGRRGVAVPTSRWLFGQPVHVFVA